MHPLKLDGAFCIAFVMFGRFLCLLYCLLTLLGVVFEFGVGSFRVLDLVLEIFIGHFHLSSPPSFLFECLASFVKLFPKHGDVLSRVSRHFYGW